jgi:hypothetical protein
MRHLPFVNCVALLALPLAVTMGFFSPLTTAQSMPAQTRPPFEITQVDLVSLKNWNSTQVSVLGLMPGMTRRETLMAAQKEGLRLDDDLGQGCLTEKTCNVLEGGRDNGVSLIYGENELVERFRVEARLRHTSREERSGWIVSRFQGETRRLFESYSDSVRNQILGPIDKMWVGKMERFSAWDARSSGLPLLAHRRGYQYRRYGLILYVDLHEPALGSDNDVEKLTIEFVPPAMLSK